MRLSRQFDDSLGNYATISVWEMISPHLYLFHAQDSARVFRPFGSVSLNTNENGGCEV